MGAPITVMPPPSMDFEHTEHDTLAGGGPMHESHIGLPSLTANLNRYECVTSGAYQVAQQLSDTLLPSHEALAASPTHGLAGHRGTRAGKRRRIETFLVVLNAGSLNPACHTLPTLATLRARLHFAVAALPRAI